MSAKNLRIECGCKCGSSVRVTVGRPTPDDVERGERVQELFARQHQGEGCAPCPKREADRQWRKNLRAEVQA